MYGDSLQERIIVWNFLKVLSPWILIQFPKFNFLCLELLAILRTVLIISIVPSSYFLRFSERKISLASWLSSWTIEMISLGKERLKVHILFPSHVISSYLELSWRLSCFFVSHITSLKFVTMTFFGITTVWLLVLVLGAAGHIRQNGLTLILCTFICSNCSVKIRYD
jgi:hypothetical protein